MTIQPYQKNPDDLATAAKAPRVEEHSRELALAATKFEIAAMIESARSMFSDKRRFAAWLALLNLDDAAGSAKQPPSTPISSPAVKSQRKRKPSLRGRARNLAALVAINIVASNADYRRLLVSAIARLWRDCTPAERIAAFAAVARPPSHRLKLFKQ